MPNRLVEENSPYLLQHSENPVEWYPWSKEALDTARRENKPIFLSIGYSACHWCHVMAHESFEDPATARIMNESFVNIKVDREERPDLDTIYMNAVVAMTGQGGWPMSVFLTPEGKPFYGGTYFPPARRYNMPSFQEILMTIARLWQEDRDRLEHSGEEISRLLASNLPQGDTAHSLDNIILENAAFRLAQSYDWKYGGWGQAPKFPQPMAIEFLLQRASRGDQLALDIAKHALYAMAKGGMYDVIGGGFSRYSTDNVWLVPHFEKMLYDNAQLARVYLHSYLLTGDIFFRRICEGTLDFIIRELSYQHGELTSGGFFSSLDADSEGQEGKYYVWQRTEIKTILDEAQLKESHPSAIDWFELFSTAYQIPENGNFEGRIVLQRSEDDEGIALRFGITRDQATELLQKMHSALLHVREERIRPGTDDKVLVSWNALALIAFAEAARYLKRSDYLEIARLNAQFMLKELYTGDRLLRSWRNGSAKHNAYLEDYSSLILGLLALYQSDNHVHWFHFAMQLAEEMMSQYTDPAGGFFDTRRDHENLIVRPKDIQDNATPSGNSLAAIALLQLSGYTGNESWRKVAEVMLIQIQDQAVKYPTTFSKWLCAIDLVLHPPLEIVILGDPDSLQTKALIDTLWSSYRNNALTAISHFPPPHESPPLLMQHKLLDGKPTAYVCKNFVCHAPTNSPNEFLNQLSR
jgi:uncharacterized protein YyaL (SSP411 family)